MCQKPRFHAHRPRGSTGKKLELEVLCAKDPIMSVVLRNFTQLGRLQPPCLFYRDSFDTSIGTLWWLATKLWEEKMSNYGKTNRNSHPGLSVSGDISPTAVEVLLVGEAGRIELFEQLGQPGFYRARVISDPLKELDGAEIISGEDQALLVPLMAAAGTATFNGTCGILVRLADGRVMTPKKEAE